MGKDVLSRGVGEAIPSEEWFSDPTHLRTALEEVGLADVEVRERTYEVTMPISDYLTIREVSMGARLLRSVLGTEAWDEFRETTATAFRARFQDPLVDVTRALLCAGTKT